MHPTVMDFIRGYLYGDEIAGKEVLEIGSRSVNGSPRPYVTSRGPKKYIGIDIEEGEGVDEALDGIKAADRFGQESFDIVICTEVLEHVEDWKALVSSMKRVLRPGGILILTTRSPGFPYHPHPIDCWRFTDDHIRAAFSDMKIERVVEDPHPNPGVFLRARKPEADWKESNLSYLQVVSVPQSL